MRVTRLEIFGFKSFVDRLVLNFDRNLIGIVGPNGCGKSNIVDAMRWVLGESHARQLRGVVFDDLIFNGSQSRRPLGMAEVSITIRPNEDWSPSAVARISTPGLEGSGDLLVDMGIEPEVKSVLARSTSVLDDATLTVDGEIFRRADDPDLLREEGPEGKTSDAGKSGLEKDGEVPTSLFDLPGLFQASEIQLTRRLYRSGESEYFINRVPCRLRDMVEFYRLIGLGARGLSIVQQGQIADIIGRKPAERRELLEEAAGISGFRARIEVAKRKLERTSDNILRLKDIVGEVEKQVRILARQAKRARDRAQLKTSLEAIERTLFKTRVLRIEETLAATQAEDLKTLEQIEALGRNMSAVEAREEESRAQLTICDDELFRLREERELLHAKLSKRNEMRSELQLDFAKVEGELRVLESSLGRIDRRKIQLSQELERRRGEIEKLNNDRSGIYSRLAEAEEALRESTGETAEGEEMRALREEITSLEVKLETLPVLTVEVQSLEANARRLRDLASQEQRKAHEKRLQCARLESEIASLEAQLEALAQDVRKSAGFNSDLPVEGEVLLAGISAPAHLQRPLAAVLGERAKFLVTADWQKLLESYESNKEHLSHKNAQFGVFRTSAGRAAEKKDFPAGTRRLLDELKVDASLSSVAEYLLGNVVLVSSLTEAASVISDFDVTAVTLDGEVCTAWGWWTTEGKGKSFSFRPLLESRREELRVAQDELRACVQSVADRETELARESEVLKKRVEEREELAQQQKRLSQMLQDLQRMERHRRDEELRREREAQAKLRRATEEYSAFEQRIAAEERRVEEIKSESAEMEREVETVNEQARALEDRRNEVARRLESFNEVSSSDDSALAEEKRRLDTSLKELEGKRDSIRVQHSSAAQTMEEARRRLSSLESSRTEARIFIEKSSLERGMLLEDIRRYYGPEIELPTAEELIEVKESLGDEDVIAFIEEQSADALSLRARLEREGEVDPQSIQLFEEESARLSHLQAELADLESASETLARTVKQLTEISRERFMRTFEDVSSKFSELIPRLFGGGAGKLELMAGEDPLSSGIEIVVRPPGKKVRAMDLLSGGEKALTATAILVAMFLHRPAPVCILDEVDAPLDDANLERFLGLVREIAKTTQFLMITHNKQSMAAVDRLVGITMEESGVSKALSVTLEEAASEMERLAAAS